MSSGRRKASQARGTFERLVTRTASGAVYALAIFFTCFWGAIPVAILMALISWVCCSEFFAISRMMGRMPGETIGIIAAVAYPLAPLIGGYTDAVITFALVIASGIWFILTPRANVADVAVMVFGPIYTGFMISSITSIRIAYFGVTGALMTLGVVGSVWASDAAAYFVGSRFGRHKMVPKISPNKTWEGFVGGLIGSEILWIIMWAIGLPGISLPFAIVAAFLVCITSVVGDLVESRMKRAAGVKDSGNFMPGHGGLLDRQDAQLFGCMTGWFMLKLGGIL